jgi:hypothetical protein
MVATIDYRTNILRDDSPDADASQVKTPDARFFEAIEKRMVHDVHVDDLYGTLMKTEDKVLDTLNNVSNVYQKYRREPDTITLQLWHLSRRVVDAIMRSLQLAVDREFTVLCGLLLSDHNFRISMGIATLLCCMLMAAVLWV